jgi:hypothetical protein
VILVDRFTNLPLESFVLFFQSNYSRVKVLSLKFIDFQLFLQLIDLGLQELLLLRRILKFLSCHFQLLLFLIDQALQLFDQGFLPLLIFLD